MSYLFFSQKLKSINLNFEQKKNELISAHEQKINDLISAHEQKKNDLISAHEQKKNDLISVHEQKINDLISVHERSKESDLTVIAYPWQEDEGDDGWIIDDRVIRIGYQFQLFIKGIPCFDSHKVVLEKLEKKQVNREKIEQALSRVMGILEAAASKNSAFMLKKPPEKESVGLKKFF